MNLLDHVTVTASDFPASCAFYDAALAPLGLDRIVDLGDEEEDGAPPEAAGWGTDGRACFWLVSGRPASRGGHVAFRAGRRAEVEAFHAAALAAGGTSHDAPRRWTIYRTGQFHAVVADPDGNLVEVIAPE